MQKEEGSVEKRKVMIRGRSEERGKETDGLINHSSNATHKVYLSHEQLLLKLFVKKKKASLLSPYILFFSNILDSLG